MKDKLPFDLLINGMIGEGETSVTIEFFEISGGKLFIYKGSSEEVRE